jgi:hypothetical protein
MSRVFLSYAREDRAVVERIYDILLAAGHQPWMDARDLVPGEAWDHAIRRAIHAAEFFVSCFSAHSILKRGYFQKEITIALDLWQERLVDDIYLIPIRLDDTEPDERFRKIQWIIWGDGGDHQLLNALKVGAARLADSAKAATSSQKVDGPSPNESGFRFVPGPAHYSAGFLFFDWDIVARNTAFCWTIGDMKRAHEHRPKPESYVLYGEALGFYHKHRSGYSAGLLKGIAKDIIHAISPPPFKEYYVCFAADGVRHTARRDGGLLVVLHNPL